MKQLIDNVALASVLEQMGIAEISQATIRQSGEIARTLEKKDYFITKNVHLPALASAMEEAC